MNQIEKENEKIRRAKEIIATTQSPYLKRDLQKYVRRTERKIKKEPQEADREDHACCGSGGNGYRAYQVDCSTD